MKNKNTILPFENATERDQNGNAIINMKISNDDSFLSPYSASNTPVISAEVAEFLENSTQKYKQKEDFTLHIYANTINEDEKILYKSAIRKYYSENAISNNAQLKRNNIIALILLFLGILVLASSILFSFYVDSLIWAEVIDIVAWVLIWESTDIFIFKNNELRVKRKRFCAFANMQICFFENFK